MTRRDWAVWSVAILLSAAAHIVFVVGYGQWAAGQGPVPAKEQTVTRISFRAAQVRQDPAPAPVLPPQAPPKPVAEKTAKPKPQPKPRPVRKPKPAPPTPAEVVDRTSAPDEAPLVEPSAAALPPAEPEAGAASAPSVTDPALFEMARSEYLARLMAHIEANKRYPRAARRRGIEGRVEVVFILTPGGGIADLQTRGGRQVLRQAAEDAVRGSLPLPPPPKELELPLDVAFSMVFALH